MSGKIDKAKAVEINRILEWGRKNLDAPKLAIRPLTQQPEDERIAKAMWRNWYGSSDENKDDALWSRHRAEWLAAWKKAFCNLQIVSADTNTEEAPNGEAHFPEQEIISRRKVQPANTIPVPADVWKRQQVALRASKRWLENRSGAQTALAFVNEALAAARTIEGGA